MEQRNAVFLVLAKVSETWECNAFKVGKACHVKGNEEKGPRQSDQRVEPIQAKSLGILESNCVAPKLLAMFIGELTFQDGGVNGRQTERRFRTACMIHYEIRRDRSL